MQEGPERIDYKETSDVSEVHAAVKREHRDPRADVTPIPLWLTVLSGAALVWAGLYMGIFHGGFRGDVFDESLSSPRLIFGDGGKKTKGPDAGGAVSLVDFGKGVYNGNCQSCHMNAGQGNPAMNIPPVANSEWVKAEKRLVAILLKGLVGPVTVQGKTYNGSVMPPWEGNFNDKKLAGVATYVRASWGNATPEVSEAKIKAARAEFASRKTPWTEADLLLIPEDATLPDAGGSGAAAAPAAGPTVAASTNAANTAAALGGTPVASPQGSAPTPGAPAPGAPAPGVPAPGAPAPGAPAPGAPAPGAPAPGAPAPGAPAPGAPTPGAPAPGAPAPGAPAPGAPAPGAPTPGAPAPGAPAPGAPAPGAAELLTQGKAAYMTICVACHQPTGLGLPPVFPPLTKSEYVIGSAERFAAMILKGNAGPMTVEGKLYNSVMPGQEAMLSDEKIAAIMTYVRANFGNNAPPASPEVVKAARLKFAERKAPWTEVELKAWKD